jgi:uncharacterized membrane-anchored protein
MVSTLLVNSFSLFLCLLYMYIIQQKGQMSTKKTYINQALTATLGCYMWGGIVGFVVVPVELSQRYLNQLQYLPFRLCVTL